MLTQSTNSSPTASMEQNPCMRAWQESCYTISVLTLHGRTCHLCTAAFKADSRISSTTPHPKSLTKFAVFETVFCKFCYTVLSAERLFKGKGRVSDKLQHF